VSTNFLHILLPIAMTASTGSAMEASPITTSTSIEDSVVGDALDRSQYRESDLRHEQDKSSAAHSALRPAQTGSSSSSFGVAAPVIVDRNSYIRMEYSSGGLSISAEGRALQSGRAGEVIKVMNASTKMVVPAIVVDRGLVAVR
jgi:flagella basal body P-ring formation protein FlgA